MRKILLFVLMATLLAGCDQNLSATVYIRDIHDLLGKSTPNSIPIDVDIEILATGIDEQCSKPEGRQIVEAIASVFQKAVLIGCEKVSGSMNDRMNVRATTELSTPKDGDLIPGNFLVHFDVFNDISSGDTFITVRFNPEKYKELKERIENVNMMLSLKLDEANITVLINNDERNPVDIVPTGGVWADGEPLDVGKDVKLAPRQEITIKLGDVKMAYLFASGWAGVATIKGDQTTLK